MPVRGTEPPAMKKGAAPPRGTGDGAAPHVAKPCRCRRAGVVAAAAEAVGRPPAGHKGPAWGRGRHTASGIRLGTELGVERAHDIGRREGVGARDAAVECSCTVKKQATENNR